MGKAAALDELTGKIAALGDGIKAAKSEGKSKGEALFYRWEYFGGRDILAF